MLLKRISSMSPIGPGPKNRNSSGNESGAASENYKSILVGPVYPRQETLWPIARTGRFRPRAEILPSITRPEISADERARVSKRRAARLRTGIPKMPRVDHMWPDLKRNWDIG